MCVCVCVCVQRSVTVCGCFSTLLVLGNVGVELKAGDLHGKMACMFVCVSLKYLRHAQTLCKRLVCVSFVGLSLSHERRTHVG